MKKDKQLLNAESIIDCIAGNGTVTQIQVEKQIHLKRTSVFNIFEELKNAGLIVFAILLHGGSKGASAVIMDAQPASRGFYDDLY